MANSTYLDAMKKDNGDPPINNNIRKAWNDYTLWLQQKGLRGNPILDKNFYGKQVLSQYMKENPTTPLRHEHIKPIQQDFLKYKDWVVQQVKAGKDTFEQGVNENNFMDNLSKEDGYAGSLTTKHRFPEAYLKIIQEGKPTETIDKGFATTKR